MKRSTNHILAAVLAGLFGLFVTYGSLTSSDFVRGIYGQPNTAHWIDFDSLHPNRVWNYSYTWGDSGSLQEYLNGAGAWNIKPFLRLDPVEFDTFYLEYYSCGQHHLYQAEWDYELSSGEIILHPEYFYHFDHDSNASGPQRGQRVENPDPENGYFSWKCTQTEDSAGIMLFGPRETLRLLIAGIDNGTWAGQRVWPDAVDDSFRSIIRVMADLEGLESTDTVFYWQFMATSLDLGGDTLARAYIRAGDFGSVSYPNWKQFEFTYTIPNAGFFPFYTVEWMDTCDFWVDWIEFYDMNRGRYLFTDQDTRDSVLGLIAYQCDQIEGDYPNVLAGWKQSDEPPRSAFDAHGVVNLMARTGLLHPTTTPNYQLSDNSWLSQRPELFVLIAKPPILEMDVYPFRGPDTTGTHYFGSQAELDTLAARLERCYQAAADSSIPLFFTGQGMQSWKDGVLKWRNPERSEILVESFMALAHGAEGVTFFRYRYSPGELGDTSRGLVDSDFTHDGVYFAEKWQAVQDVFAQLDAIGDTLLDLVRDTAFCVFPTNSGFKLPITNVYFTDDPLNQNYIEVGQFHLPPSTTPDYLIIVNRRTDADRHITVETNLPHTYALRDIYTQERFISSTGDFKAIPFEAGEGRAFALEPQIALDKSALKP